MSRGGKRPNAGRKPAAPVPKVRRDVAYEILEVINRQLSRPKCSPEAETWLKLLDKAEPRLEWDMRRYVKECVDGKPKQRVDPLAFDPNAPLRVIVEHIGGRAQIPIPTQAKPA